jgi:hypothetical protein
MIVGGFFLVIFLVENLEESHLPILIIFLSFPKILKEFAYICDAFRRPCLEHFSRYT